MQKLLRKPRVENKYNLNINKIKKLKIGDRSKISEPLFWRNNVINAWCISGSSGTDADHRFGTDDGYWIGIYDENAKSYAGKFRFNFTSYGGMCSYNFTSFYRSKDIENENDLRIQELFLEKINYLIDNGILILEGV